MKLNQYVEIGGGDLKTLRHNEIKQRINFDNVTIYEPNLFLYRDLLKNDDLKIKVYNKAVSDFEGNGLIYNIGYASFLWGSESFLKLECESSLCDFLHPLATSIEVISGENIEADYLVLTCNGSELNILNKIKFKPQIIETKIYAHNVEHWNYYNKVLAWLSNNGYSINVLTTNKYNTYYHLQAAKI